MRADVVIVGGGFSGLWTAYHLLKEDPGMTVVVIEASAVGYGASGRNGGFAMTLIHRGLKELVAAVGAEQAKALHLAAEEAIDSIGRVCEAEKIDADLQPNGLLTISNSPLQDEILRGEFETAERLGLAGFEFLEEEAIRSSIHSETFRCAVREESCTLLNPARLVRGLKRAVIRAGGRVFEQTPMERLENTNGGVRVVTPKGAIEAQRVLLAANAYSSRIPSLERYVMPFYSYILLSRAPERRAVVPRGVAGARGHGGPPHLPPLHAPDRRRPHDVGRSRRARIARTVPTRSTTATSASSSGSRRPSPGPSRSSTT